MLIDDIKTLPNEPGVYQFFDENLRLLYVGKAKNLKNRVKSYFKFIPNLAPSNNLSQRIGIMVSHAKHLKFIVTNSESDALILENSFIKQLKPKYNILLRDDKTYPYIYIDLNDKFPRFELTRKVVKSPKVTYFGPFFKGARDILNAIYQKYKLVRNAKCNSVKKACIYHQINLCSAPCIDLINKQEYANIVNEALKDIKNPSNLLPFLTRKMQMSSELENYEQAAKFRDAINIIRQNILDVEVDIAKIEDFDVVVVICENNCVCIVKIGVRDGKISSSKSNVYNISDCEFNVNSIYKQVILDSYPKNMPMVVNKIYVLQDFDDKCIVEEILTKTHNKKIKIIVPKAGQKYKICQIGVKNAKLEIKNFITKGDVKFLDEFKNYFCLENFPNCIEAFDNSHIFGKDCVGAMISYIDGNFYKQNYRHFHLVSKDDYHQMNELLSQRVARFDSLYAPDLWIIDGGKVLWNLANEIILSCGVNVDIIAISKEKREKRTIRSKSGASDKIYTKNGEFILSKDDKKLQFIQKLRDESHRFAISFHRKIRQKNEMQSLKMKKNGLSDADIVKLLNYFGSFENIYNADKNDILRIFGSRKFRQIYDKIHRI